MSTKQEVSRYELFPRTAFAEDDLRALERYDWAFFGPGISDRTTLVERGINSSMSVILGAVGDGPVDAVNDGGSRNLRVKLPHSPTEYLDLVRGDAFSKFILVEGKKVAVDITGLPRPFIAFILKFLIDNRAAQVDFYYVEPRQYSHGEGTDFGRKAGVVAQVPGFAGVHSCEAANEVLIIGVGYETQLIQAVANKYDAAKKIAIFCLPSTQPDFYQESVIQAARAEESIGAEALRAPLFFPANDPFRIAEELSVAVRRHLTAPTIDLYLAPLATKPQALGFGLWYLMERANQQPVSMVFPFGSIAERREAVGHGTIWRYTVEYGLLGLE